MNNTNEQGNSAPESELDKRFRLRRELMKTLHHYDINPRTVYHELRSKWKDYDRNFLLNEVTEALHNAYGEKHVMTYFDDGSEHMARKIKSHSENYFKNNKIDTDNTIFPIDYYYVGGLYKDDSFIVCFDENCVVERDTWDFNLLFALQFSLTPIVECREFLNYQLGKSFKNNASEFAEYLDNICLEYKKFLNEKHEPFCRKYIAGLSEKKEPEEAVLKVQPTNSIKLNWQGQSNSLTYLFRQLKAATNKKGEPLLSNSYEDIARFIQDNFEGYEEIKISTIAGQLKKTDKPKKADKKIELYV